MKNILLILLLATAAMAVASVSSPHVSGTSVFEAKGIAVLAPSQVGHTNDQLALVQINDCCGDPLPECPPICPDSPMAPMAPATPMAPKPIVVGVSHL